MSEAEQTTLEKIHAAAKEAFMEYGYKSATLRSIVKTAGVTLGAFYGYYNSKEELFEALVGEQYNHFITCYRKAQTDFRSAAPKRAGGAYERDLRRLHERNAAIRI